jgi:hypothetical protein
MTHDADVVAEAGSIDDFAWQGGIVSECLVVRESTSDGNGARPGRRFDRVSASG